jgi:uroporphyrinogen-III decarboxylase
MVSLFGNLPGQVAERIGLKSVKWAGKDLGSEQEFQFVEDEYLQADEYDQFLSDPSDFVIRKIWPRITSGFEPLESFPSFLMLAHGFAPIFELPLLLAQPEVREMLQKLIEVGEQMDQHMAAFDWAEETLRAKGLPLFVEAPVHAPFDFISDYFRGIRGTMLDMYYQPDNLKAAINLVTPRMIEFAIQTARDMDVDYVSIPLHRGADPFMSNEQFAEFYWPGLKEMLLALVEAGITPVPYFEGSYTNRLEFLAELPPRKIWGHFDVVDRVKAREILSETMCFWGNVPIQTLISGTPEGTSQDVQELIGIFGDTGGLIIDGSAGIPKEAKVENVRAMIDAAHEYGKY